MAIELRNSFTVALPVEQAWPLLNDIERVVPCVPGIKLTEVIDANTFKGEIAARLGPIGVTFAGTATVESRDETTHTTMIKAQGNELQGRGGAQATVRCRLTAEDGASRVDVETALELHGQLAQYGRAAGMIEEVAGVLVDQFAERLATQLVGAPAERPPSLAEEPSALSLAVVLRAVWRRLKRLFGKRQADQ